MAEIIKGLDGKTPLDLTERQDGESTGRWLARLVERAALSRAAFSNIADAGRVPLATSTAASDEMSHMRSHQAYGQVRSAAHAGRRYLDVIGAFELK